MLDHHPEIAFEKEFDFAVDAVSDTGELPSLELYLGRIRTARGVHYAIDQSLGYRELVDDFLCQKQADSGGKRYVGATVHRHFDRLRFLWPHARYIHLVRDPRDVARSVFQKGWSGNLYQAAEFWIQAEESWDSLLTHLLDDQSMEVHYEELVTRTERTLSDICRFIGVEFDRKMLQYQDDARQYPPPDPTLASQWKTKLSPRDTALVEVRTARMMTMRGYALSGYPLPTIGPVKRELLLSAARVRRLRTRVAWYGPGLVAIDVLGRRFGPRALANHAQRRINAIDQAVIDEEAAGVRAPSSNIAPVGPPTESEQAGNGGDHLGS